MYEAIVIFTFFTDIDHIGTILSHMDLRDASASKNAIFWPGYMQQEQEEQKHNLDQLCHCSGLSSVLSTCFTWKLSILQLKCIVLVVLGGCSINVGDHRGATSISDGVFLFKQSGQEVVSFTNPRGFKAVASDSVLWIICASHWFRKYL